MCLLGGTCSTRDLSSPTRDRTRALRSGNRVLTTGVPEKGLNVSLLSFRPQIQILLPGGADHSLQKGAAQSLGCVFCEPVDGSTPGLPVPHHLPESGRVCAVESAMPSSRLVLCRPLFLLPQFPQQFQRGPHNAFLSPSFISLPARFTKDTCAL